MIRSKKLDIAFIVIIITKKNERYKLKSGLTEKYSLLCRLFTSPLPIIKQLKFFQLPIFATLSEKEVKNFFYLA